MATWMIVLIVIAVILIAAAIILYFLGKRSEKKQAEQQEVMNQHKQQVSMLIIDKKRIRAKDADLPEVMKKEIPWYMRRMKLPIVKAKVGPQIVNLIADERIFDDIPVKKQVKAMVSGLYIVEIKALHGKLEKPVKKKGVFGRFLDKVREVGHADVASSASKKK